MNSLIKKRVALTERPSNAVEEMAEELREGEAFLKFSDSQLVGEIVEIFFKKYFAREKKNLKEPFFDRRQALLKILKESKSDEDLQDSLAGLWEKKRAKK